MKTINKSFCKKAFKIILSLSIVISGILLILGCLNIFYAGNGYSREIIKLIFSKISIPIFITIALIIIDFIIELFSKESKIKQKFLKPKNFIQNKTSKISTKKWIIIKIAIIVIAISSIIFGAFIGGYNDVLTKAVNICTECIGLG